MLFCTDLQKVICGTLLAIHQKPCFLTSKFLCRPHYIRVAHMTNRNTYGTSNGMIFLKLKINGIIVLRPGYQRLLYHAYNRDLNGYTHSAYATINKASEKQNFQHQTSLKHSYTSNFRPELPAHFFCISTFRNHVRKYLLIFQNSSFRYSNRSVIFSPLCMCVFFNLMHICIFAHLVLSSQLGFFVNI